MRDRLPRANGEAAVRARGVAALAEVYAGATPLEWDALVDQLETVGLRVVPAREVSP